MFVGIFQEHVRPYTPPPKKKSFTTVKINLTGQILILNVRLQEKHVLSYFNAKRNFPHHFCHTLWPEYVFVRFWNLSGSLLNPSVLSPTR